MHRGIILFIGILGVVLSLAMAFYSVLAWEIAAVLVAVFLGIPSLLLTYGKVKPEENILQERTERRLEKEKIELSTPSGANEKEQKIALLLENGKITELKIDDNLLDQIYGQAYPKAVDIYPDAKFSAFCIQVFPFYPQCVSKVNIYLDFYSKWADRICSFLYSNAFPQVRHTPPDKRPKFDSYREVFTTLPWKESPQWKQFLERVYAKIGPFAEARGTNYHLRAHPSPKLHWTLNFNDNFSGNEYSFEWNGKGLDENSVKQLD